MILIEIALSNTWCTFGEKKGVETRQNYDFLEKFCSFDIQAKKSTKKEKIVNLYVIFFKIKKKKN